MVTNTKAVFSCSTLYSLIDTTAQVVLQQSQPYLTCTIDSQWNGSGVNLICQSIRLIQYHVFMSISLKISSFASLGLCDDFNITYGNVSYRNNLYYHSPNDTASVTCFQSYRLEGPGVHTCLNGVWSPPINTTTCLRKNKNHQANGSQDFSIYS